MSQGSQASTGTSGLVRVTVASGTRRVDLVLPGAVPVAELIPELARSVGLLDAATVYGGYQVVTPDGRQLANDSGLILQGIEDGGILTVSAGVNDRPPRVYDDVVEAMTDIVERDLKPWEPASGRRTALAASGLLMALGAVALGVQYRSLLAGVAALVVGVVLVAGAVVLSRAQREPEAAVAVAWMGAGYAAVAGLMLALRGTDEMFFQLPIIAAGGGALVAGLVALVGLGEGRILVLPPVVVGAVFVVVGLVLRGTDFEADVVFTVVLVLVVMAGSVFPWLALGVTGTRVVQLFTNADIVSDPDEIDAVRVGADARVAHEILISISGTVGLLLVLVVPLAVQLGVAGAVLALVACLVVMLRTRQYRTGSEVLVGLVSGIAGLVALALALLRTHAEWRPTIAVVLAATGAVLLAVTLLPATPSLRRGRFGDLAETVCLLALLPLVVVATGLFSAVGG